MSKIFRECCRCKGRLNPSEDEIFLSHKRALIFCKKCMGTSPCFACKLPAGEIHDYLADGQRIVCTICKPIVVDMDNKKILHTIRKEIEASMERIFNMILGNDIFVKIVNLVDLQEISPSEHIMGVFRVEQRIKRVYVISGLLPGDLVSVLAHEMVHAWQFSNHINIYDDARKMAIEGFAEWVAYHITSELRFTSARDAIKSNFYKIYSDGFLAYKALEKKVGIKGVMAKVISSHQSLF